MDANLNGGVSMDPGTRTVTLAFSLHQLLRGKKPSEPHFCVNILYWRQLTGVSPSDDPEWQRLMVTFW